MRTSLSEAGQRLCLPAVWRGRCAIDLPDIILSRCCPMVQVQCYVVLRHHQRDIRLVLHLRLLQVLRLQPAEPGQHPQTRSCLARHCPDGRFRCRGACEGIVIEAAFPPSRSVRLALAPLQTPAVMDSRLLVRGSKHHQRSSSPVETDRSSLHSKPQRASESRTTATTGCDGLYRLLMVRSKHQRQRSAPAQQHPRSTPHTSTQVWHLWRPGPAPFRFRVLLVLLINPGLRSPALSASC